MQVVPKVEHPWVDGFSLGFRVNGVEGPNLKLTRGTTYSFRVDSSCQYPFYLSTDSFGNGAAEVTPDSGQKFYCEERALLRFTPTAKTPDLIYYQSKLHQRMGGPIVIVDPPSNSAVQTGTAILFFICVLFLAL